MKWNRKQRLVANSVIALILQLVNLLSGFLVPRLILARYGSDVNGLVNSISQFLGAISLLDLGVGTVVESTLYKPLAEKNHKLFSEIVVSATKFFRRLAFILIIYTIVLMGIYPSLVNDSFDYIYTATLIGALSISSFVQYYFGIVNGIILSADQRGFINSFAQIITIVFNTIISCILIKLNYSIQIVKLVTSIIFLIRPLLLNLYVKKNYIVAPYVQYKEEPIKQKWDGVAQHLAYYVLTGTDNIVLTIFSSLENVSIYSVYNLVINGVKSLLLALTQGFKSVMGDMLARGEVEALNTFFGWTEWMLHTVTILIFGCTGVLIVPFIQVYTKGISDANYNQQLFAILITLANAAHCIRLPYNNLILASGHYKQTRYNYIISIFLNIVISVITVEAWGLIGVSIGTFVSMLYQTIWMAWYVAHNIINRSPKLFCKQCIVDVITVIIAGLMTYRIPLKSVEYFSWILQASIVFTIWLFVILAINILIYRKNIMFTLQKFKQ